jgi:peroxiredoxin
MDDEALAAALALRHDYPDSEWADWASRAVYEFENLLPGMEAPAFSVVDTDGNRINSEDLRGKYLILEFFEPRNEVFLKEFGRRETFVSSLDERAFQVLSISLEPDQDVNEALFEEGKPPGRFAFVPEGRDSDIARLYNIQVVPTRFLIDPDGIIVRKYPGSGMLSLAEDVAAIYARLTGNSSGTDR